MKKTAITLLSGGLDSAVATLITKKKHKVALALTFDYGQRSVERELKVTRAFCRRYKIDHEAVKIPWLAKISHSALTHRNKKLPSSIGKNSAVAVWVANRNAIFTNIAAAYAEALKIDFIIAGFNKEEAQTFPDNSAKFVEHANKLLSISTLSHPRVLCPTQKMSKTDIAAKAVMLKLDPNFFWSCYEGGARMCAHCESCIRIIRAFKMIHAWDLIKSRFE